MGQVIANYVLNEKIYQSVNSEVYRGIRRADDRPVILKFLQQDYPTPQELTRYRQEYAITRTLNLDGVIKAYALEPCRRTLVIILEDFGASSLDILRRSHALSDRMEIGAFLHLAIQITQILGEIHASGVIHKDINPANIVLNPETNEVKIIDFGISTILNKETPTLKHPNVLEGTLAYISPEQTGRNESLSRLSDRLLLTGGHILRTSDRKTTFSH